MKIATFNANSIRSRMPPILEWLKKEEPDILCIQETKAQDVDFPVDPIVDAGYEVVFKGQKSYNGVAIISKSKADAVRSGFDDGGQADESRLLHAQFGNLHVINTYVPQGRELDHEMYQYKLDWFKRLTAYFDKHASPTDPVIWTGDMNVADEPIDVFEAERRSKHVCYHDDVRTAYKACCAWGFEDVFRKLNPEAVEYTFYDYRTPNAAKRGMGWRIDSINATAPLVATCTKSWIDIEPRLQPKSSDHTFLVAEFK